MSMSCIISVQCLQARTKALGKDSKLSLTLYLNHGWVMCKQQNIKISDIFTYKIIKEGNVSKKIVTHLVYTYPNLTQIKEEKTG